MTTQNQFQSKTVGVFFGGRSPEHDISIVTAMLVMDELKKAQIPYEPIYIATDGSWCAGAELQDRTFLQTIHSQDLYRLQRWSIDTRHREPKLILTRRPNFFSRRVRKEIDIVFPTFHGAFGEDGSFQGLCEMLNVPYVGCDVLTSSVAMDKVTTKRVAQSVGIEVTSFFSFSYPEWDTEKERVVNAIKAECTFPVFVKPPHAGSSIGITKVSKIDQLDKAIDLAFTFDSYCLVESAVTPVLDLTCCVRQNCGQAYETSEVQESTFVGSDFFTYEEKYLDDGGTQLGNAETKIVIPANIPDSVKQRIQEISQTIAAVLYFKGMARIDFLYNRGTKSLYLNEINPLPGTLYHHLWKKSGVETQTLIKDLLLNAEVAAFDRSKKSRYFPSDLLQISKGSKVQQQ